MIVISRLANAERHPKGRFSVAYSPPGLARARIFSTLDSKLALRKFLLGTLHVEALEVEEALARLERNGKAKID